MIGRKRVEARLERWRNARRAEGVQLASTLLQALADSTVLDGADAGLADMRRGLLVAAGFTSVLSTAIRTGENEIGMLDIDGETIPVDLTLRAGERW